MREAGGAPRGGGLTGGRRRYGLTGFRAAEWVEPGQYRYSSTGLKGSAAAFWRHQTSSEGAGDGLCAVLPAAQAERDARAGKFDVVVPAIGYVQSRLPRIELGDGTVVDGDRPLERDAPTSQLVLPGGELVPRLFGVGVGWWDYFERPNPSLDGLCPLGFGGAAHSGEGFAGEKFVGINAFIARSDRIATSL